MLTKVWVLISKVIIPITSISPTGVFYKETAEPTESTGLGKMVGDLSLDLEGLLLGMLPKL